MGEMETRKETILRIVKRLRANILIITLTGCIPVACGRIICISIPASENQIGSVQSIVVGARLALGQYLVLDKELA